MALVPIREYAEKYGVSASLMRERCQRGSFKTAIKFGGSGWFVDDEEVFVDHRKTPENGIGGPGRKMINSRFRAEWSDEFLDYWPEVKLCTGCSESIRPRWLDIQLEGWDLTETPYEEWRPVISKVFGKLLCERCAARMLDAFDRKYE